MWNKSKLTGLVVCIGLLQCTYGFVIIKNNQRWWLQRHNQDTEIDGELVFNRVETKKRLVINKKASGSYLKGYKVVFKGPADVKYVDLQKLEAHDSFIGDFIRVKERSIFHGKTNIQDGFLSKKAIFKGPATVKKIEGEKLEAHDSFTGEFVRLGGPAVFHGRTRIKEGSVKDLEIHSRISSLRDIEVKGSIVLKSSDKSVPQILKLKGATEVSGDIIFEGAPGKIYLIGDKVKTGKLHNGQIYKQIEKQKENKDKKQVQPVYMNKKT